MGGRVLWIIQWHCGFVCLFLRWLDCLQSYIQKCSDQNAKYQNRHAPLVTFHLSQANTWRGNNTPISVIKYLRNMFSFGKQAVTFTREKKNKGPVA